MVGARQRVLASDRPDFHIRVNGLRVPVYKTPFTRATYQRMIMEGNQSGDNVYEYRDSINLWPKLPFQISATMSKLLGSVVSFFIFSL